MKLTIQKVSILGLVLMAASAATATIVKENKKADKEGAKLFDNDGRLSPKPLLTSDTATCRTLGNQETPNCNDTTLGEADTSSAGSGLSTTAPEDGGTSSDLGNTSEGDL